MNRTAPLVIVMLSFSACFPKGAPPPAALQPKQVELAKARDANTTEEQLESGRKLFVEKCGECHDHPDLTAVRLSKWPGILKEMLEKADLEKDAAASANVTAFTLTAAEAAGAKP